jgi:golgi to ER traffic protein 4
MSKVVASTISMPPPPSSAKALNAILPVIAAGQPYEAHQKARTFAARYTKTGAFDVAIDVLYQSSTELFKAGHLGSGTDLGSLLIDTYENKGETVTAESRGAPVLRS